MLTLYGVVAVSFMMLMYALETRHPRFILAFVLGCVLSSIYGFLSHAWPFGAVEAIWSVIAVRRYRYQDVGSVAMFCKATGQALLDPGPLRRDVRGKVARSSAPSFS